MKAQHLSFNSKISKTMKSYDNADIPPKKKRSMSPISKGNTVKYPNSGNAIIKMNKQNVREGSRKKKMRPSGGI